MTLSAKLAGAWDGATPSTNVSGTWKEASAAWVNVDGTWEKFFQEVIESGDQFQGGFAVGQMQYGDGVPYWLIIADKMYQQAMTYTNDAGTFLLSVANSMVDGKANAAAQIAAAGADAVVPTYCAGLTISGFSDWYPPSYYEMELIGRMLKPSSPGPNATTGIQNTFSVPEGPVWTTSVPGTTDIPIYEQGGAQALNVGMWTSTVNAIGGNPLLSFLNSSAASWQSQPPTVTASVRPVRRVLVTS